MTQRFRRDAGFTLIELMIVLAILSILAAMAMVSHRHFTEKARSVEAEVALSEINRLETLYHANHGTYSADVTAIGFSSSSTLKYYRVMVQLQDGGRSFQAMAVPLAGTMSQLALVLTHTKDGTALQKSDLLTHAVQGGSAAGLNGLSLADQGAVGAGSGTGANPAKGNCRQGGEATVAEDGLLDMNFCLK
jgi:prepilin-type N-terminal cleavage/methylation domain-containing protein